MPREEIEDVSFLGPGWHFPFRFDSESGGVKKAGVTVSEVGGLEHVKQSIRHIVSVALNERCMRPDFGTGLHALVFEPNDQFLIERAKREVIESLDRWEPRIILIDSSVTQQQALGILEISVTFRVAESNTPQNVVFPFYLLEENPNAT